MPLVPSWQDVVLRLALAVVAGLVVGFNREERSQAAGLRTTVLICVAACLAMVLANELLDTTGKDASKFAQIDVLRLPLGILSGIGFIGAGAIIKRGDTVMGVATAATIWFMTVVGLCFGAGQLDLGAGATALAVGLLWGLRWIDLKMPRKFRGDLTVSAQRAGLAADDLRGAIAQTGQRIIFWAVTYEDGAERYEVRAELEWRGHEADRGQEPDFVKALAVNPAVHRAAWQPAQTGG
ncbi:MgtC/SapB family protein [Phenylobacterium sp.]|uniref:MgtC/SapB family protein n=1 Tax=Phenylobacterium sp. TaxID=1871053 RepID=UPI002DE87248|nr:MgtC/SapB family protein [Phenylobacterium sp.]